MLTKSSKIEVFGTGMIINTIDSGVLAQVDELLGKWDC